MAGVSALRFDGLRRPWEPLPVGVTWPRLLGGDPRPKGPGGGRGWLMVGLVLVLVTSVLAVAPAALRVLRPAPADDATPPVEGVDATLASMPLSFIENRGQVADPVSYYV